MDSSKLTLAKTRKDLLEAASGVFCEFGYRDATVREICLRAKANVAAVNYHFGDKAGLYRAVLEEAYHAAIKSHPPDEGLQPDATPEQRLEVFIKSFIHRIFSEGPAGCHAKLMAREMIEPTPALDLMVQERMKPMAGILLNTLLALLPDADEPTLRRTAMSIVGQCLFYHHCRPVISRMFPALKINPAEVEEIGAHITRFSLGAIRSLQPSTNPKVKARKK